MIAPAFAFTELSSELQNLVVHHSTLSSKGEVTVPGICYTHKQLCPVSKLMDAIVRDLKTPFDSDTGGWTSPFLPDDENHFVIKRFRNSRLRRLFQGFVIPKLPINNQPIVKIGPDSFVEFVMLMSHKHIDEDSAVKYASDGTENRLQKSLELLEAGDGRDQFKVKPARVNESRCILGLVDTLYAAPPPVRYREQDLDIDFLVKNVRPDGTSRPFVSRDVNMQWSGRSDHGVVIRHPEEDKNPVPKIFRVCGYDASPEAINSLPGGLHEDCIHLPNEEERNLCPYVELRQKTARLRFLGKNTILAEHEAWQKSKNGGNSYPLALTEPASSKKVRKAAVEAGRLTSLQLDELDRTAVSGRVMMPTKEEAAEAAIYHAANPGFVDDTLVQSGSSDPEDLPDAPERAEEDEVWNKKKPSASTALVTSASVRSSRRRAIVVDDSDEEDENQYVYVPPGAAGPSSAGLSASFLEFMASEAKKKEEEDLEDPPEEDFF